MPTIDLYTKVIPGDQNVWIVYAGKKRKHYKYFYENKRVFLEMPSLDLTQDALSSDKKLRQHIRRAKAWNKYHQNENNLIQPSDSLGSYPNKRGRDITSDFGNVKGLFCNAKVGDLVIVTGEGYYKHVLIGEISHEFNPNDKELIDGYRYGYIQYRRVKWLNKKFTRHDFGHKLSEGVVNRRAVTQLKKSLKDDIYKYAYGTYTIKGKKAKVDLYGKEYKGNKILSTNSSTELIAYLTSAYAAIEKNELDAFGSLGFEQAIERYYDESLIDDFSQNFNSPGIFQLFTKSTALAAFVIIGVTVFTNIIPPEAFANDLNIINSIENEVDEDHVKACNQIKDLLGSIAEDACERVKERAADAKEKIDLKTTAKVSQ